MGWGPFLITSMTQQLICPSIKIKVTRHLCFKNGKNLHLLDILACKSANKPSFQNLTKSLFVQCSMDVKSAVTFKMLQHFLHLWSIGQKEYLSDFENMVY